MYLYKKKKKGGGKNHNTGHEKSREKIPIYKKIFPTKDKSTRI